MDKTYQRFLKKIKKFDTHGCWEWIGAINRGGYGNFWFYNRIVGAHRASYFFKNKIIHSDLDVCHRCDNPACVNPGHLYLTTHRENMRDKIKKGRDHNQRKTHCKNGHPYIVENMRRDKLKKGHRVCLICAKISRRKKRILAKENGILIKY